MRIAFDDAPDIRWHVVADGKLVIGAIGTSRCSVRVGNGILEQRSQLELEECQPLAGELVDRSEQTGPERPRLLTLGRAQAQPEVAGELSVTPPHEHERLVVESGDAHRHIACARSARHGGTAAAGSPDCTTRAGRYRSAAWRASCDSRRGIGLAKDLPQRDSAVAQLRPSRRAIPIRPPQQRGDGRTSAPSSSFAEKQDPHPALVLVVRAGVSGAAGGVLASRRVERRVDPCGLRCRSAQSHGTERSDARFSTKAAARERPVRSRSGSRPGGALR